MKHLFKFICVQLKASVEEFLKYFPGALDAMLRYRYWKGKFRKCGTNMYMDTGITIRGAENIELGEDVGIMARSYLYAHNNGLLMIGNCVAINTNVQIGAADEGKIIIGNDVLIGPNAVIRASNHVYDRI